MLKVAVISDVHGNLPALEAVLEAKEKAGCEQLLWCLGDTFSGPGAADCFRLLLDQADVLLGGNHEAAVLGIDPIQNYAEVPAAIAAIRAAQRELELNPELRPHLETLHASARFELENGPIVLYHGSPVHPLWHFVLSDKAAWNALIRERACQLMLVGHTHKPAFARAPRNLKLNVSFSDRKADREGGVELGDPEEQVLLNPGSVGAHWRTQVASWGILSLDLSLNPLRFDWVETPF